MLHNYEVKYSRLVAKRAAAESTTAEPPAVDPADAETRDPARPGTSDERVIRDPVTIRALAHPARLAVLEELAHGEELTATECAELTGLSASAMSYHLRALEKYGFVERVEPRGDGRERPWRSLAPRWRTENADRDGADVATAALIEVSLQALAAEYNAWAAVEKDQPEPWHDKDMISISKVWLTPEEVAEAIAAVTQLAERWRDRSRHNHPAGARRVRLAGFVLPTAE